MIGATETRTISDEARRTAAHDFFESHFGGAEGHALLFRLPAESRCYALAEPDALGQMAADAVEWSVTGDVYFNINTLRHAVASDQRGAVDNGDYAAVTGFVSDVDIDPTKPNKPHDEAEAMAFIEAFPLAPSRIVRSGRGLHVYHLFKEAIPVDEPEALADVQAQSRYWGRLISRRAAERGLTVDSVGDLARILRPDGTFNWKPVKTGGAPLPVATAEDSGKRYLLEDLVDVLPDDIADENRSEAEVPEAGQLVLNEHERLAITEAILPYWDDGNRHRAALHTAGWLATNGVAESSTIVLIEEISVHASDADTKTKVKATRDTYRRMKAGRRPQGWTGLKEYVRPEHLGRLDQTLRKAKGRQAVDQFNAAAKGATDQASNNEGSETPQAEAAPKRLRDFAGYVNDRLNKRAARRDKQEVAELIGDYFDDHDRLLIDDGAGDEASTCPYLITDDDTVVSLAGESKSLRAALADCGINPTEPAYQWLLAVLQERASRGRKVRLARYSTVTDGTLYVSCGPSEIVRVTSDGFLRRLPNGSDGVLFAADAVLPAWDPAATPIDPLTLKGLQPPLDTPAESEGYTADAQRLLSRAWLVCLIAGTRPLPIMTATGQKGAGKSTQMRSIIRLLMGPTADVNDPSLDARDFAACVTQLPILVLDNLDNDPPPWLRDAMASATTGQTITRRTLYTDMQLTRRPATAALGVTTRTASFAARLDMQERVLPIFTGRPPERRIPDRVIMAEVAHARDGCLVWLAQAAATAINTMDAAPINLPGRFVDFERTVWTLDKGQAWQVLTALQRAQLLAVVDPDPLLAAIVSYVDDGLRGSAADIVRELSQRGALLPYFGSGKAIANRLRELTETLRLVGIRLEDRSDANRHRVFNVYRTKIDAQTAQSAHLDNPSREKESVNGHKSGESPGKSADCAVCADQRSHADTLQDLCDMTAAASADHEDVDYG